MVVPGVSGSPEIVDPSLVVARRQQRSSLVEQGCRVGVCQPVEFHTGLFGGQVESTPGFVRHDVLVLGLETGEDLRIRDRGDLRTIVNYAPKPRDASHLIAADDEILVGASTLEPGGVTILKRA